MKPWYWMILAIWAAVMLMGVLVIHDYGWSAVSRDPLSILIFLLPVWIFPFGKRKKRDLDL